MDKLILALAFLAAPALAQSPASVCGTPAHAALDFWIGEWDLTWATAEGEAGRGRNAIVRTLDGCVVHERFESEDGFRGESFSIYDPSSDAWRQMWVDSGGGYFLLSGGPNDDGVMELRTAPFTDEAGRQEIKRMIWTDVTGDDLTWRWQRSVDGGATWEDSWTIHYARR